MSATSVINNLQQAKKCAGRCDCCQSLQQQINQLKAEIKTIPRIDEQKIIKQSVASAEDLILPSIGVAVARALLPIDDKIAQLNSKLLSFGNTAKQALSKAGAASKLANTANNIGSKALGAAKGAAGQASNALAKHGALATAIFSIAASLATLHVLGGRIDAVESGVGALGTDVSKILGQLLGIKTAAQTAKENANDAINKALESSVVANFAKSEAENATETAKSASQTAINAKLQAETALKTSAKAEQLAQTATGVASTATGTASTATGAVSTASASATSAAAAANQALALAKQALAIAQGLGIGSTMDDELRGRLNKLEQLIGNLNISLPAAIVGSAVFTTAVTNAAATGVCKTTKPGGCLNGSLGKLSSKLDKSLINTAGIGTVSAQVSGVSGQLGVIQGQVANNGGLITKLSAQVAGGFASVLGKIATIIKAIGAIKALIIAKFAATWAFLTADRTLNVFTAAASLHNAYMLSGSLSQTLFSIVDNIGAILFKDAAGQSFSVSKVLGKGFDDWAKGAVGVVAWEGMKAQWKKWNRIYQAGANIINSVRSMMDSVRNISEYVAENTGRIGNALKRFAVVGGDAFKWMPEQVDGRSIWMRRLENLQEAAEGLEMITGEVLSITENVNEIKEQTDEFKKSIGESPVKPQIPNAAVTVKQTADTNQSKSPIIPQSAERNA